MKSRLPFGLVLGIAWLILMAVAAFEFDLHMPRSLLGVILFVLIAPPAYLVFEGVLGSWPELLQAIWATRWAVNLPYPARVGLMLVIVFVFGAIFWLLFRLDPWFRS